MINGSELDLFPGDIDIDLVPAEDWAPKEPEMAKVFVDFLARRRPRRPDDAMQRSTDRILTTHTGSPAAAAQVVELPARTGASRGQGSRTRDAVREAVAEAARRQVACGLDVINDGEQGHRLHTREGPPRRLQWPELAAARRRRARFPRALGDARLLRLAVQAPAGACSGPVAWKDFAALGHDIARARSATAAAGAKKRS